MSRHSTSSLHSPGSTTTLSPSPVLSQRSPESRGILSGAADVGIYGESQFNNAQTIVHLNGYPNLSSDVQIYSTAQQPSPTQHQHSSAYNSQRNESDLCDCSSESDNQRYSRILMSKGYGFPLWFPAPPSDLPREYRKNGVSIGDVGVVTSDGLFDFFFNIMLPADHQINRNRVPIGFHPLDSSALSSNVRAIEQRWRVGTHIASASVARRPAPDQAESYVFECSSSEGAVLALPRGGSREDVRDLTAFRIYAHANALSWYQYVNGTLGYEVSNGSIYLITGLDKTISWGNASFPPSSEPQRPQLVFSGSLVRARTGTNISVEYEWIDAGTAVTNSGISSDEYEPELPLNQTIFLRGFTAWPLGVSFWPS